MNNVLKTAFGNNRVKFWVTILAIYIVIIPYVGLKIASPRPVNYLIIFSVVVVAASILSHIHSLVLNERLKHRVDEMGKQADEIKLLNDMVHLRTAEIDRLNLELENKNKEHLKVSKELREHRDELGQLVRERTGELEEMANDMAENQKALMYLVEDANDSRLELEQVNKKLNSTLRDSEESNNRINAILKSMADGLIVMDNDQKVLLLNHVAEEILNIRSPDVVGTDINDSINFITLSGGKWESIKNGDLSQFDFELNHSIYSAKTSPIWDMKGFITGMIIIFRDVTSERELDKAKNEFISTSAHELRTPLTSIRGFSEILKYRDDLTGEESRKFLGYIHSQAIHLGNIINDLLDLSRIESGIGYTLNRTDFDPMGVIRQVVDHFRDVSAGFEFIITSDGEGKTLNADRNLIIQALTNLMSNAVKYSPSGGKILISSTFSDRLYTLGVKDHGMGMTAAQQKNIFKKFYRADSTNTAIEGTGLGMSIIKNIVDAHNGSIQVESELDRGTLITVTIPVFSGPEKKTKKKKRGENEKNTGG